MNAITGLHFWLTLAIAVLAPLPYGSAASPWIMIWVFASAATLLVAPAHLVRGRQRRAIGVILVLWAAYMAVAFVQSLPDPPFLANVIWSETNEILGTATAARISVRQSIPSDALGRALLAMLAFCNGYVVGAKEERAALLLDRYRIAGVLYAAYAIFAELVMPSRLLLRAKSAYAGDITGSFVNRNTAATFLGVIAILWLFSTLRSSRRIRLYAGRLMLLVPQNEGAVRSLAFRTVALAICVAALAGTHSRGGAASFGISLIATAALAFMSGRRLRALLVAAALGLIIYGLGGGIGGRISSEGVFDGGRWMTYRTAWELIVAHPFLGTGLGTFADIFPSVHSGADTTRGVWDMAHNTILEIAIEMGLPIALSIVSAAFWIVRKIYAAALASEGRRRADLLALASVAVLAFTHSLSDFSLQIPGFLTLFAVLLGVALSSAERSEAESARK
jgi:O-antigen ligase